MSRPRKAAANGAATRPCPWCSAPVVPDAERCPSCGAALRDATAESGGPDIPGLTRVDPGVSRRRPLSRPNRLVGWLADVDTGPEPEPAPAPLADPAAAARALEGAGQPSVAPPSEEVRREMRRLELEAIRAELEARAAEAKAAAAKAPEARGRDESNGQGGAVGA